MKVNINSYHEDSEFMNFINSLEVKHRIGALTRLGHELFIAKTISKKQKPHQLSKMYAIQQSLLTSARNGDKLADAFLEHQFQIVKQSVKAAE
jgi:hypothetical protein